MALEDSGTIPLEVREPRYRCQHAIRHAFTAAITRYYKTHPMQLQDPDAEASIDSLFKLMLDVFGVLDRYEIQDKQ